MELKEPELEPKDYFEELKTKLTQMQAETLDANRKFLYEEIQRADRLGQKNLIHKSSFIWEVLEKEMILHAAGITNYVNRADVVKFIDNVKPKNSVKIIELENYPRVIPERCAVEIENALKLNLFDKIVIIYTDFTNEEVHTPAQKEYVARNRDPIALGMFVNEDIRTQHDRMYFITDWEDEFCDLTFTKMLDKMIELGIKDPNHEIHPNFEYVNAIISRSKSEIKQAQKPREFFTAVEVKKKENGFVSYVKRLLGNG